VVIVDGFADLVGDALMPEHYTKTTVECTAWCSKCQRNTQHRVNGGRRGPCVDPAHPVQEATKAQLARKKKEEEARQQPALFETKR
jgi:hypothetical protein